MAFILLLGLSFFSAQTPYFPWDLQITLWAQHISFPGLYGLMWWVSYPGFPNQLYFFLAVILIVLAVCKKWREFWYEIIIMISVGGFGYLVKYLVNRPRTYLPSIQTTHLALQGGKYSFPAGHVQSYVAILGFLTYVVWEKTGGKGWLARLQLIFYILLIILIGPSRIYLGEHWASDVLGGYLLGIVILFLAIFFYQRTGKALQK